MKSKLSRSDRLHRLQSRTLTETISGIKWDSRPSNYTSTGECENQVVSVLEQSPTMTNPTLVGFIYRITTTHCPSPTRTWSSQEAVTEFRGEKWQEMSTMRRRNKNAMTELQHNIELSIVITACSKKPATSSYSTRKVQNCQFLSRLLQMRCTLCSASLTEMLTAKGRWCILQVLDPHLLKEVWAHTENLIRKEVKPKHAIQPCQGQKSIRSYLSPSIGYFASVVPHSGQLLHSSRP